MNPESVGLSAARLDRLGQWGARYVEQGKLAGVLTLVARRGEVAHLACHGMADIARGTRLSPDTLFRIYSMTKPITSLAIMMLYEEGHFLLDTPISKYLPEFRDMRVMTGGSRLAQVTEPAARGITFRDLLTHTAGLSYGFMETTPVDALYRARGVDFQTADATLAKVVARAAAAPLLCQPGSAWHYSIATDVLGHLVAVVSGMPFEDFLRSRIFAPLGMDDTSFCVPPEKMARFAANYAIGPDGRLALLDDPATSRFAQPGRICSGGGGLVSTAADYLKFCRLMLGNGALGDVRLISRKTVALMTADHVGGDLVCEGLRRLSGRRQPGIGWGLGFAVMLDPAAAGILGTVGEYAWSGAASTAFFIDPAEDMAVILMTQMMPSSTYALIPELRVLAYQAIVD